MTVAGTNAPGFAGDGMVATNARLNNPADVVLDPAGRILIADTANNRIRRFGQGPTLELANVTTNQTGQYRLVITSPLGSVSSSNVNLTVVTVPRITAILANAEGRITLNLATTPNVSSRLLAATNLTPPVIWQAVATNPVGGNWQFEETNAAAQPFQVYRLSTP